MNPEANAILKRRRYEELMQAGRDAYRQGNPRLAHDHWREAAMLDPYSEQVWLALFRVLETDADRLVCLKNIIAINPMNIDARRRLQELEELLADPVIEPPPARTAAAPTRAARRQPTRGKRAATRTAESRRAAKKGNNRGPARSPSAGRWLRVVVVLLLLVLLALLALVAAGVLPPP